MKKVTRADVARDAGVTPFFLPDFNLEEMKIKNILVFVDTSGSMPHMIIKEILEEIKTAISD